MSPRAASRLESIGFERVYDYVAGKADWGSAGLRLEGANGSDTRAGAHLRTDVPTCRLDDRLQAPTADLEEADLQPAPFEPDTLPDPTLVTDRHKRELAPEIEGGEEDTGQTEQRSPWQVLARLIVPIGVVLYILVTTLVDR